MPCGPIHRIDQVFADPQVRHLGMARPMQHPELGEIEVVGHAGADVGATRAHACQLAAAPHQGDDTEAILAELGYTAPRIAELRAANVV